MAKLKNVIKQLSETEYNSISEILSDSSADKSYFLLKYMRERNLPEPKIMEELEVNPNAYYTLRSRLNQKIEEYLLHQIEDPRTEVLRKVANIHEVIFVKKRAIAVATLKKLEKELLDYDLSSYLTVVYKLLKKLHINTHDYFNYSQLYNHHVSFMLSMDKTEDLLGQYFKKYGEYTLNGDENTKAELEIIYGEMRKDGNPNDSHRQLVYQSCLSIFHDLLVRGEESIVENEEPIEDIIANVENIFNSYKNDSTYQHLRIVFEFLKLEYYNHYRVFRKAEKFFGNVNCRISNLMSNYSLYTYPAQFLITKIKRHLLLGTEGNLAEENEVLFADYEPDIEDIPKYTTYIVYRAISFYYAEQYDQASRWINRLLNEVSYKNYPKVQAEVKMILAIQYCLMKDFDLFTQLIGSIQRQIRILGKEEFKHLTILSRILKLSLSDISETKEDKLKDMVSEMGKIQGAHFTPTELIKLDGNFIGKLI